MKKSQGFWTLTVVFCAAASLSGQTLTYTDGASAGFANGSTNARVGTWNTATESNAAPFNGFIGSDTSSDFSASWTFNYSAISDTIIGATLELGIYDIDSAAALDEVASYTDGSVDLTSLLNSAANALNGGTGAKNNEYDILTVTLPSTAFAGLAAGTADISLTLKGPGLGTLGTTTSNGAGIDFSTLTINTQPIGPTVPEPATLTLLLIGGGLTGLVAGCRRLGSA